MIIVFSMVIAGLSTFLADLNHEYGLGVDTSWNETYNQLDQVSGVTEDIRNATEGSEITTADAFETISEGGMGAMKLVFNSFSLMDTIMTDLMREIGLPPWLYQGFLAILIVIVSFLIISAIFRVEI